MFGEMPLPYALAIMASFIVLAVAGVVATFRAIVRARNLKMNPRPEN